MSPDSAIAIEQRAIMIPFNKPFMTGKEVEYMKDAVKSGKISGNGEYTQRCHLFFKSRYGFENVLLTNSCTDALEMCAHLLRIEPGDEVIIPSFTFVSTANAFVLRGARIVFADSESSRPHLDADGLESLITPKTKAIVPVHYGGTACDMDKILELARRYGLSIAEDAAQAVDAYYKGRPLGSIGNLAAFSFHETKNVISGEGGMLAINDKRYSGRAEIIWEKGTNRAAFFRGEIDKYGWVDIGSSYLPSEITSAFLFAQLENLEKIQTKRKQLWSLYNEALKPLSEDGEIKLPVIPDYASNNAHLFYILCKSVDERTKLINYLQENDILAVFHYLPLHSSPFYRDKHDGRELPNSDRFSDTLLRLPLFYELSVKEVEYIVDKIYRFFRTASH